MRAKDYKVPTEVYTIITPFRLMRRCFPLGVATGMMADSGRISIITRGHLPIFRSTTHGFIYTIVCHFATTPFMK